MPGPLRQSPESIRLTHFSRLVADASGLLASVACAEDNVTLVAAGEHTFGLRNPSTTDKMYGRLLERKVDGNFFALEHPTNANDSTAQLLWLEAWRAKQKNQPQLLLVGHGQHYPRLRRLGGLFGIENTYFVDATGIITDLSDDAAEIADAAQLATAFRRNQEYEDNALRWVERTARWGAWATQRFFHTASRVRTPNVVDATHTDRGYTYSGAISAKKRVRQLQDGLAA
jgi:hypothetical protein